MKRTATLIMLVTFLYLFSVTFFEIPQSGIEHSKTITGFLLGTGFGTLLNYYWGASRKNEQPTKEEKKDV